MTVVGVARVTVSVADLDRALRLYSDVLGLTPLYRTADLAMLAFPGGSATQLLLHRRAPVPSPAGVAVSLAVEDVDAVTAAALEAGAQIVDALADQPWRERQSVLTDADGHIFCLVAPLRTADRGAGESG